MSAEGTAQYQELAPENQSLIVIEFGRLHGAPLGGGPTGNEPEI